MALFDRQPARDDDEVIGSSDAATRALSVADFENSFVERVYDKLSSVYDLTFGPLLHPGRIHALQSMTIDPSDTILEVGVGTGGGTVTVRIAVRLPPWLVTSSVTV